MNDPNWMIERLRASLKSERKLRQQAEGRIVQYQHHITYLDAVINQMRRELEDHNGRHPQT